MSGLSSSPDLSDQFSFTEPDFKRVKAAKATPEERIKEIIRKNGLNAPQGKFLLELASGKSEKAAMQSARRDSGSRLSLTRKYFQGEQVQNALTEMMEEVGLGLHERLQKLADVVNSKDLKVSLSGLKETFRLAADYPTETKAVVHTTIADYKELQAEAKKLEQEITRMEVEVEQGSAIHHPIPALPSPQTEQT